MIPTLADMSTQLAAQEAALVFDTFDHGDAWRLGTTMAERAIREDARVIIDIRRPVLVLFRYASPGTTAENEAWLDRKARTALRFETSTALLDARFTAEGVDARNASWFDAQTFAATGGSVPVRVRGVGVVAAVTVSGLTSDADHDFVIDCLDAYRRAPA